MVRLYVTFTLLLYASCSTHERIEHVPEYMYSVFPANQTFNTISYVKLDFGDSSFFLSDTLENVNIYDNTNQSIIGASLAKTLTSDHEPDVLFKFFYYEDIEHKYTFIKPGSYKFYDSRKRSNKELEEENIGIQVDYGVYDSYSYYRSRPNSSSYFYVNGKSGDDFQMRLCGEFNIQMQNIYTLDTIRVKGEYGLLFTDYFF